MRRLLIAALVAAGIAGTPSEGNAKDAKGAYMAPGNITCGEYLDAYSRSTLTGGADYRGPQIFWFAVGFINGFVSGANALLENGKKNVLAAVPADDPYRWVASWCRDNPSRSLVNAVNNLITRK